MIYRSTILTLYKVKESSPFLIFSLVALQVLSACGGGSTSGDAPPLTNSPFTVDPNTTVSLTGVSVRTSNSDGISELRNLDGLMMGSEGSVTVSDGDFTLIDPDAFDELASLSGGGSVIVTTDQGFTGEYEYLSAFTQTYTLGSSQYDVIGFLGVAPGETSGFASYSGEASGFLITSTNAIDLFDGRTSVEVDFSSGSLSLELDDFSATDQVTGQERIVPFDTISGVGMNLDNGSFSGSTVDILDSSGNNISLIGLQTDTSIQGSFFGEDALEEIPDELGGFVITEGESGLLSIGFVAD